MQGETSTANGNLNGTTNPQFVNPLANSLLSDLGDYRLKDSSPCINVGTDVMPITTMNAYDNPLPVWNEDIQTGIVNTDLDRIEYYLQCGWSILGLQDQNTNAQKPYAIGGNIANMTQAVSDFIQHTLEKFSKTYL